MRTGSLPHLQWPSAAVIIIPIATLCWVQLADAQDIVCPAPTAAISDRESGAGSSANERLHHRDPLVRDMARADIDYAEGRRDAASAIYRRLAQTPPDRRQTARRAKLKLAQAAISAGDLKTSEELIRQATSKGALPKLRMRARHLEASVAHRRQLAEASAALAEIEVLADARRFDEAVAALDQLLVRPCPYPDDYRARVELRIAQMHRARGDFPAAQVAIAGAAARATTASVREGIAVASQQIVAAAAAAKVREVVARGKALIDAGDASGAIAVLEPLLALQPPPPPEVGASIRFGLARAYRKTSQFDKGDTVLKPLLEPGTDPTARESAAKALAGIDAAEYNQFARTVLASGALYQQKRDFAAAEREYASLLRWSPPPSPDLLDSARLGLARAQARQGNIAGAQQQIAVVRANSTNPRLTERADDLLTDIEDGSSGRRLSGFVQAGTAYDSNAPTLLSVSRDQSDSDVPFPADRRFEDVQVNISGRVQYRAPLGVGTNYLTISSSGLQTFQADLTELDRTMIGLRAGPTIGLGGGSTKLQAGASYDVEWRGGRFRSSEPGVYLGITTQVKTGLSATVLYTLTQHNDFRSELDGLYQSFEGQLRFAVADSDTLSVQIRARRKDGETERVRNWALLGGAGWRHRWIGTSAFVPFIDAGGEIERVRYDGSSIVGGRRRDWKIGLDAGIGADIYQNWRVRFNYAYFDINTNESARDRRPNHRAGVSLRYSY